MTTHIFDLRLFEQSVMKTIILAIATASMTAHTASANDCTHIIRNLKASASAINLNADAYWTHRGKFVDLKSDQARRIEPDALSLAEQEETQGDALKAAMPGSLASLKNWVAAAKTQNCLSPKLEASIEATTKLAKGVNFDLFPEEELPTETSGESEAPRMPLK